MRETIDQDRRSDIGPQLVLRGPLQMGGLQALRQIESAGEVGAVADLGGSWWRVLAPRWRRSQKALDALCVAGSPPMRAAQLALLDGISESIRCAGLLQHTDETLKMLFGATWRR